MRRGQKKKEGKGKKTPREREGERAEREGGENEYGLNLFNYLH